MNDLANGKFVFFNLAQAQKQCCLTGGSF